MDAEADLLVAGDLRTKLEFRPAAGDGEIAVAGAKGRIETQLQVERGRVHLQIQAIGDGERAVDGGDGIDAGGPGGRGVG